MNTHDTYLIGFDEFKNVVFFKSYDYSNQKEEVQADIAWVYENCDNWKFMAAESLK